VSIDKPSSGTVKGLGLLRLFACWDSGFESLREHGGLSIVSVVCFEVEVCATGYLQSVVCLSVNVKPRQCEGPGPLGALAPWGGSN
jgi:hypothetical protein